MTNGPAAFHSVELRRSALVVAAYEVLAEKGFEGLRTRDVAARVGVNVATLHYYFESKEQLIEGVVEHVHHLFRSVQAPPAEGASGADLLRQIFENQLHRRRVAPELEIVVTELLLRARRDPGVRKAMGGMLSAFHAAIQFTVVRCQKEGLLSPKLDAALVAATIAKILIGTTLEGGVRSEPQIPAIADLVVSLLTPPDPSKAKDGTRMRGRGSVGKGT